MAKQSKREKAIRAALKAWETRYLPGAKGGKFTTKQRDLLMRYGLLKPIVKPLTQKQRAVSKREIGGMKKAYPGMIF